MLLAALGARATESGTIMSVNTDGRLTVRASHAPASTLLLKVCEAAGVEWPEGGFRPGNRVTLAFRDLEPDDALLRVLAPYDYVIDWPADGPPRLRLLGMGASSPLEAAAPVPAENHSLPPSVPAAVPLRLLKDLADLHAAEETPEERRAELEQELREWTDPAAEGELKALAARPAGSALREEAAEALANLGTATAADFLLERVERGGPDAEEAARLVANLALSPRSAAALRHAAAGNKRFSSPATRLAALEGFSRLRDGATRALLDTLSKDPDERIRQAALARLAADRRGR